MEKKLQNVKTRLKFMLAGKAIFSIESKVSGKHYTYKIIKKEADNGDPMWFVFGMTGTDNISHYSFLGTLFKRSYGVKFYHGKKSKIKLNTPIAISFKWFLDNVNTDKISFYHEGHCAKCGRRLTDPKSIETGFGPVCILK